MWCSVNIGKDAHRRILWISLGLDFCWFWNQNCSYGVWTLYLIWIFALMLTKTITDTVLYRGNCFLCLTNVNMTILIETVFKIAVKECRFQLIIMYKVCWRLKTDCFSLQTNWNSISLPHLDQHCQTEELLCTHHGKVYIFQCFYILWMHVCLLIWSLSVISNFTKAN